MLDLLFIGLSFFFKQKTAYEMRISDWSSDVCSSDLGTEFPIHFVSRAFTECEARWSTIEQECFAIYYAITRSEEHTSELQSLMRISYAVFCLKKKNKTIRNSCNYYMKHYTRHKKTQKNTVH